MTGSPIDRRDFVKRLGVGALGLLAAACAPSAPSAPAAPKADAPKPTEVPASKPAATTAPAAPAAAAKATAPAAVAAPAGQSGKLTIAVTQWGSGTPFGWKALATEQLLWGHVFDRILLQDPKTGAYQPGLATEWKPSDDYKTWTFKLRQGVMFHEDFGELTAEDVKFSLEQNLKQDAAGNNAPYFKQALDRVETPDKYTFVLHLKNPSWELLGHLGKWSSVQLIWSKKYFEQVGEEKAAQHPIGSGPYRHVDGKQGEYQQFEALSNHWRVVPQFKELVIRRIPDAATALAGVRTGEVDITMVVGDLIDQAKRAGLRLHVKEHISQYWGVLPGQTLPDTADYNPKFPWVGEPDPASQERARKVRLALNHAVDKKAIIEAIWRGYGNDQPFSYWHYPMHRGYKTEWAIPAHDPSKAKALLAEAGYPNGFEITALGIPQNPDSPDLMEAISLDWEKLGIKVSRRQEDFAGAIPKIRGRKGIDGAWVVGIPSPVDEPSTAMEQRAGTLLVQTPEITSALQEISRETNADKRTQLTTALSQKLYDGYHGVMIGTKSHVWALSKQVGEWPPNVPSFYVYDPEYITRAS